MLICPNGHENPHDAQLCQECDAFLVPARDEKSPRNRVRLLAVWAAVATVLLVAVMSAVLISHRNQAASTPATPTAAAAVRDWWPATHEHVTDLENAIDDVQSGLKRLDKESVSEACQRMHDAGTVDLQARLPSPDPDLTAELEAAIQDVHDASHMCMAAVAGTMNNYDAEFVTRLDEAKKHLDAAVDLVTKLQRDV